MSSGEIVPVQPTTDIVAARPTANPFDNKVITYHSMDRNNPEHQAWVVQMQQGQDYAADDVLDQPLCVEHLLCHGIQITDRESGEIKDAIRTVLRCVDGSTIGCVSGGIFRSLGIIGDVYGPAPWVGGRWLVIKSNQTASKRRMFTLMPCKKPE